VGTAGGTRAVTPTAEDRERSGARGGTLQNEDGINVYRPVGRRTRSTTALATAQAKDALCFSPAGDDNDGGRRERPVCENKAVGLITGSADRVRLVGNRKVSSAGAFEDVLTRAETELVLSRPAAGDHNSKVMVPGRPREVSVSWAPTDDSRKGVSKYGHYHENKAVSLRTGSADRVRLVKGKKIKKQCHEVPASCTDTESNKSHTDLVKVPATPRHLSSDQSAVLALLSDLRHTKKVVWRSSWVCALSPSQRVAGR